MYAHNLYIIYNKLLEDTAAHSLLFRARVVAIKYLLLVVFHFFHFLFIRIRTSLGNNVRINKNENFLLF